MKSLVGFSVAVAKYFNLLHFLVVFFGTGKKFQQPGFEQLIGKGRFEKSSLPRGIVVETWR